MSKWVEMASWQVKRNIFHFIVILRLDSEVELSRVIIPQSEMCCQYSMSIASCLFRLSATSYQSFNPVLGNHFTLFANFYMSYGMHQILENAAN